MHSIANGSASAVGLVGSVPAPVAEISADSPDFLAAPVQTVVEIAVHTPRRLVVRLLGGEEVALGDFDDRNDAIEAAQELVARFSAAETSGEWPEVDGRFLRVGAIASVDVLQRD